MDALSPAGLLLDLETTFKPWILARKGFYSLAGDPGDVLEALADKPLTFRVVLAWGGDEDQTGQEQAGIVTNTFEVWIIKAKGLRLKAGDHLVRGDPAFLELVSDVRAFVRAHEWPAEITQERCLYTGCRPIDPELSLVMPTSGYKMTFQLIAAMPVYEEAAP